MSTPTSIGDVRNYYEWRGEKFFIISKKDWHYF